MATSKLLLATTVFSCTLHEGAALTLSRASSAVEANKNRPVSKVITLLKDMQTQLVKEAEEDEKVFKLMACWCTTNDKDKTKAIADAEAHIEDLTTKNEEYFALSAQLNTELANHKKELAENQQALDTATALREKQLAEFQAEEKDLSDSISSLTSAVAVLSKHQSLVQLTRTSMVSTLRKALPRAASFLTKEQSRIATSFLQEAPSAGSYAPQSGEIFGILSQMNEEFQANLAAAQKEEQANQKAYEDLKAAKEAEIAAGQAQIEDKTAHLADIDEKNAQAKEDMEDTQKSLAADQEFLAMLKEKCSMTDSEWNERQKTRQDETTAVNKALEVLSGDDAHDLFSRSLSPAFVQTRENRSRREAAARLLESVAKRVGAPKLSTLAMRVKLDAFERVKKAIDDMISALTKEKADEIKHKDFCVEEFNANQLQAEQKTREQSDSEATIEDQKMTIKTLTEAIEGLKNEIHEMQVQMKRAGEDREAQNHEFQTTVADQRETERLLTMALNVLQDFYGKKEAAFEQQEPAGPPPPAGFKEYKKNEGSSSVMSMIEQIIADAKAMEAEAIKSEEDSQKAYEDFVKETNASIEAKSNEIINKSEEKAKTEEALVQEEQTLQSVKLELEGLANYKAELHESCDFVLKNFEVRQTARDEEIEALKQAKAILSGAKFD